jgi:hypothetical protein
MATLEADYLDPKDTHSAIHEVSSNMEDDHTPSNRKKDPISEDEEDGDDKKGNNEDKN